MSAVYGLAGILTANGYVVTSEGFEEAAGGHERGEPPVGRDLG